MFIRFSDQEDINDYVATAINSAGSQRLQDGTKIVGALKAKETILVWTDNALYTMKFIGAPFTFGFEQVVQTACLIGKNAAVEIDGSAFWLSPNGFFMFDGTVKSLPCSVEDFVLIILTLQKVNKLQLVLIIYTQKLFGIIHLQDLNIMINTLCTIMVNK